MDVPAYIEILNFKISVKSIHLNRYAAISIDFQFRIVQTVMSVEVHIRQKKLHIFE